MKKIQPWESDHKRFAFYEKRPLRSSHANVADFPAGRWVAVNQASLPEDYVGFEETIAPWLAERNIKYTHCLAVCNGAVERVVVFKKSKDVLLFKLTWG